MELDVLDRMQRHFRGLAAKDTPFYNDPLAGQAKFGGEQPRLDAEENHGADYAEGKKDDRQGHGELVHGVEREEARDRADAEKDQ